MKNFLILAGILLSALLFSLNIHAQYLNPVLPQNPVNGMEFYYFESNLNLEPAGLDTMQNFLVSGAQPGYSLAPRLQQNNYTFNFRGYIKVPADTVYTFFTNSDDGSNLYIDTFKVVSNDGSHGTIEKSGTIRLKAGYHKIRVYYHQDQGGQTLQVLYSSDLISKAVIPDSVLFRNGIPFPQIIGLRDTTMFEEDSISIPIKVKVEGGNPALLQASAQSLDSQILPVTGVRFSGSDSSRVLKLKTPAGPGGQVRVIVRFQSQNVNPGARPLRITVLSRSPSLSSFADTFLVLNTGIQNRPFTVSDPDSPLSSLLLTAVSNNESLVQSGSITFSGTGASRFLSLNPQSNVTGSATITCKVTDPTNRSHERSFVVTVADTVTFRTPDVPVNPVRGLDYLLARAPNGNVLDFTSILPDKAGKLSNFSLAPAAPVIDNFGMEFRGYVRIPKTAAYTFFTNSDDGSVLLIGSTQVVNNDGSHGAQEQSGQINLKAGFHKITVKYKEGNGGEVLDVRFSGGGFQKRAIPDTLLYRDGFEHPLINASNDTVFAYKTWFRTIPFTLTDADGDPALAVAKTGSADPAIVPLANMAVGGTGANRSLDFIPVAAGVVRLKVVMTDPQGLPAIQSFIVRVKDTSVVAGVGLPAFRRDRLLSPNPTRDRFRISGFTDTEPISILDPTGRIWYQGSIGDADISRFPKGIFFIRVAEHSSVIPLLKE